MTAKVLKFERPATKRVETKSAAGTRVTGFRLVLQAKPNAVSFVADGIELELSCGQAEELAAELIECVADARATQTGPKA